jgi:pimeloyl-ACP methyl ester carboxylesterase
MASASEVSLDSYAGRVCEVLAASSEPGIVVGHSMGGIVATQGAARCPERVAALVYVAAFLPKDGQSLLDLTELPEGDGEQVLANVVVEGEPPVAVMPAAASRHVLYGSCAEGVAHTPQLSMTNELAKALHRFATHSTAGAGTLADQQDRPDFRGAVMG